MSVRGAPDRGLPPKAVDTGPVLSYKSACLWR
jgi:hypothetical protein